MPDWDPSRDGHVGHKWIVHKATPRKLTDPEVVGNDGKEGVRTDKGFLPFDRHGRFMLKDEGLASEIRSSAIGQRDVTVTRVRYPDMADRGHKFFFGQMPAMPWKKEENRIEEK